jgi:hypothetical protein
MELENMELLRKKHECRKFYKAINMARKQVKPRVNPLTPDLNPSEWGCLVEFFPGVLNFIAYSSKKNCIS